MATKTLATFEELAPMFPDGLLPFSFHRALRMSRSGQFPAYARIGNQKSHPVWNIAQIKKWVADSYRNVLAESTPQAPKRTTRKGARNGRN
jgi:hypothetical protein